MSNEIQPINKKRINGADWVLIMVDDEGCTGGECPNCEMWNHHIYNQCALPVDLTCSKYAEYFARWYRADSPALAYFDGLKEVAVPEQDPTGRDAHSPGAKLDQGKPRAALVLQDFGPALLRVADVGTFGAAKYTPHGWMSVPDGEERYLDAAMRHLLKQGADDESGIDHLAHAAWNVLAALTMRIKGDEK